MSTIHRRANPTTSRSSTSSRRCALVVEEIVDLAVVETAEGTEVTARLVRLADWESRGEWRREWRVGDEWYSCAIPAATARAIRDHATARSEPLAA